MDYWKPAAQDLEFEKIIAFHQEKCNSDSAKKLFDTLKPTYNHKELRTRLNLVSNLIHIKEEGLPFPRIEFEELEGELKTLSISNSYLQVDQILRIKDQNCLVRSCKSFFKKEDRFGYLASLFDGIDGGSEMEKEITGIIDESQKIIKSDASPELREIRDGIESLRKEISRNFQKELKKLTKAGMLSEFQESFINGRRTLSVLSRFKRDVAGITLGGSKTGTLVYIEPQVNVPLNNELTLLQDEERREEIRILIALTKVLAQSADLIDLTNRTLIRVDFLQAIYKTSRLWNGQIPAVSEETGFDLKKAYHPLLLLNNKLKEKKTFPQDIELSPGHRFLVISGPNAGGKSITLKTIGLLQLMFQCGLPISCERNSSLGVFNQILTDIGDNQSIENELSTYSYRLQRMEEFLSISNKKTLLLLDEFGTGSDPELGGALAEVFYEELYAKKSFGIVTTHYSNIKVKTGELPEAVNACMLFDEATLQPLFKLSIGQAGSSFTFEVARNNGIDTALIKRAKEKLSTGKVKLDSTLSEVQKEKSRLQKSRLAIEAKSKFFAQAADQFRSAQELHEEKVDKLNSIIHHKMDQIQKGERLEQWITNFPEQKAKQKKFLEDLKLFFAKEIEKRKPKPKKPKLENSTTGSQKAKPKKKALVQQLDKIKLGSKVKLVGGKETGTVEDITNSKVKVAFGMMLIETDLSKLIWVA